MEQLQQDISEEKKPQFSKCRQQPGLLSSSNSDIDLNSMIEVPKLCAQANFSEKSLGQDQSSNPEIVIQNQDDEGVAIADLLVIREATQFQKIDAREDRFPFLQFRKAFLRIREVLRLLCKGIISSPVFEGFIIVVILINLGTLAAEDPISDEPDQVLWNLNYVFLIIYTIQALIKILALGFAFEQNAYIRDIWNLLDFSIVISGWLELSQQQGVNLAALRIFRVLRPLRSISSIEGLKVLILALIGSFRPILVFFTFLFFFLLLFAIGGVQMLMGLLKFRCVQISTGIIDQSRICGNIQCPQNFQCIQTLNNPNFGVTSFDNIFYSFLTVFQCVTTEGWADIMISYQKAFTLFIFFYFIPLVFIGAYIILNLILAVIKSSFSKAIDQAREAKYKEVIEQINSTDIANAYNSRYTSVYEDQLQGNRPELNSGLEKTEGVIVKTEGAVETARSDQYLQLIQLEDDVVFNISPTLEQKEKNLGILNSVPEEQNEELEQGLGCQSPLTRNLLRMQSKNWRNQMLNKKNLQVSPVINFFRRTKSSFKLKKSLYDQIIKGDPNEGVKMYIVEQYQLLNSSNQDIFPPQQASYIGHIQKEYNFRYMQYSSEQHKEQTEKIHQKFCYLATRRGRKGAFWLTVQSMKKFVQQQIDIDKRSQIVQGHWSGNEIKKSPIRINEIFRQSLSSMTYRIWPAGWMGIWYKSKNPILNLVSSQKFNSVMTLLIILNTIVLALEHHGASNEFMDTLTTLNLAFTCCFTLEMLLKLTGLGIVGYCRDLMNYLDTIVVMVSLVQFFFLSSGSGVQAFRTIRIFRTLRAFRVLRVARLFRYMGSMLSIIKAVSVSLSKIVYLAFLLMLLTVIFALLGMQIFGGKFDFEDGKPRANFDNFLWSFLTVFQVLTMENWQEVLFDAMRSEVGPASALFFIVWIFLGNFVLLNLFLAILLDSFNEGPDHLQNTQNTHKTTTGVLKSLRGQRFMKKKRKKHDQQKQFLEGLKSLDSQVSQFHIEAACNSSDDSYSQIHCQKSYFIFDKNLGLRKSCYKATESQYFDMVITVIIFLSSAKLIWDTYILDKDEDDIETQVSYILDIFFTAVFLIEFLIKSISLGFVLDKRSYLRDPWNMLDFCIVIISVIQLSISDVNVSVIKVFRVFRALRPLRFISQNNQMRIVVTAFLKSLDAILNVLFVVLIVVLMFAILGVSLFGGKFYSCENTELTTRSQCQKFGYQWKNADTNFDNVLQAMMALFIVISLEGWDKIMYQAIDSRDVDLAPEKNYNEFASMYFISFILIGSFFFLNLFIGVIFDTFSQQKINEGSISKLFLARDHNIWVQIQNLIVQAKPRIDLISSKPTNKLRLKLYYLAKSKSLDIFIIVCIFLNTVQMAMAYQGASEEYTSSLEDVNLAFTGIFIIEAMIKITGLGPRAYFHSRWNRFDFSVVTASIVDLVLAQVLNESISILRYGPQLLRVIRVLRVSKLVRLFKNLKQLQDQMTILAYSLPAILNVLSLLVLIYFIYAILGVFIFHGLDREGEITDFGNFDNFGLAMLLLLRISTGEEWNLIMYDSIEQAGSWSIIYYLSFILITTFLMLNLFVMVIIQAYDDYNNNPKSSPQLFNKDWKHFNQAWAKFTKEDQGRRIHYSDLVQFMYELEDDLGVVVNLEYDQVLHHLSLLNIHMDPQRYVYYHDMLFSVLRYKYTRNMSNPKRLSHWKKILRMEELKISKSLTELRTRNKLYFYSPEYLEAQKGRVMENMFVSMVFLKTIFRTWKNYYLKKKKRERNESESITPLFSEQEYPGENSLASQILNLSSG